VLKPSAHSCLSGLRLLEETFRRKQQVPTETSADLEMTNIYIVINLAAIFTTPKKQWFHVLKSFQFGFGNQSSQYYTCAHLKKWEFSERSELNVQSLLTYNIVHFLSRGYFFHRFVECMKFAYF
jgi:hypothetical protein